MKKSMIFICILVFLISTSTTLATQSSNEYLECLSERLFNNCTMGLSSYKPVKNGWEIDKDIEPFTKQTIFDWLKNYENQFTNFNGITGRQLVLACKKQDDYNRLERYDSDKYTLDSTLITCSTTIVKEEHNLIKVIFSFISINKNSKGGIIIVFCLISIGVLLFLKFVFNIKIAVLIKSSWTYISQKFLHITIKKSKDSKKS